MEMKKNTFDFKRAAHRRPHMAPSRARAQRALHYYKEGDNLRDYITFKAEVKKQQCLKKLTYSDLEEITGYKASTIEAFMCGRKVTDNVALALAKALDIPEHLAT